MANSDKRYGFKYARTTHGGPPTLTRKYTTDTTGLYIGDACKIAEGRVIKCTADTDIINCVSANRIDACADTTTPVEVFVYDDLENTIFQAQASDSAIAGSSKCNEFYDLSIGSADTSVDLSQMEIATDGSTQDTIYVIDKVDRPDNAWGKWVDLYCKIRVYDNASIRTHSAS